MAQGSSNPTSNLQKVAGTAVDTNTGNASAGTQRVVLATNQPAVPVTGTFYQATQPVSGAFYQATQPVSGTFWQTTQPVSGTVSINAIPTGSNAIGSITNTSFAATQSGTWTIQPGNTANTTPWLTKGYATVTTAAPTYATGTDNVLSLTTSGALRVDGSGVTQPVSLASVPTHGVTGTFWQATQPVSIATMPTTAVTGTFWQTTQPVSGPVTDAQLRATALPVSGTFYQTTQPVSGPLTDAQLRAATVPVSGTVTANAGAGNFTVTQATAANLNATVTGTVELGSTSLAALENISVTIPGTVDLGTISLTALETITVISGTPGNFQSRGYGAVTTAAPAYTTGTDNALSLTTSGALRVDGSGVTQPVSGTFWQTTQPVSGPATDAQLRASALPVSLASVPTHGVTGTFWQATQPVSIATMPTTAVTGPLTDTQLRAAALPVSQSGTWTVQPGNTANTTPWLIKPLESLGTATALGALNAEIAQALNGNLGAAVVVTATAAPVGVTLTPYASYDGGTNWTVTQFFNSANGDAISTLTTFAVADSYSISSGDGATHIKVRATGWTSGSITVRLSASNSQGLVNLKSTAVHDDVAGSFVQQMGAVASTTAPTAVNANGDAVRLWATTSGALNIADGGGSITVDGTFWQATQPVSIASMPTTAVTGTFYQATQPVSIAASVAVTGPLTDTQLRATAVPITGTVTNLSQLGGTAVSMNTGVRDAGTQRVTIATNDVVPVSGTFWQTTQPVSGPLTDTQLRATAVPITGTVTNLSQLGGTAVSMNTGVRDAGTQRVTIATNDSLPVTGTFWQATQPVSLTSVPTHPVTQSGNWIVVGAGANGATATGNPVLVAGSDGTNARSIKTATDGTLLINGVQDARQTANITTAASVVGPFSVVNRNVVTIAISGTYAGVTFVIEATDDGTNWFGLQCINNSTGQAASTWTPGTNALASYDTAVGGYTSIRVRATAWTSGTAVVGISNQVFAYDPIVAAISQGTAANGSVVLGNPVLIGGSDGTNARNLSTDTTGALKLAASTNIIGTVNLAGATTNSLTNTTTTAYATSLIIKASAGVLYSLNGYNSKTSGQFIQLHNSATLPADTAVPVVTFYVPASSNFSFDWGVYGRAFSAGIVVTTSSTGPTKTIGAADCWFDATSK